MRKLRLATRKSPLAWWQANFIKQQLQKYHSDLSVELIGFVTAGDKKTDIPLTELGGKSLFVKELQTALLNQEADIAVHSVKDLSVTASPGLCLAAVCQREDPRDALVSRAGVGWQALPPGAVVGTASPRRQCQLLALRPDVSVRPLRGNVDTRLHKLATGDFDAIILACAGLKRLDQEACITEYLPVDLFTPAIGQGALGIECRIDDAAVQSIIQCLDDWETHQCVTAERAVNRALGGDCYSPLGAYAQIHGQQLSLQAILGSLDGRRLIKASGQGAPADAEQIGLRVAEQLCLP
jgi:hydroxymethylbilane synthase